MCGGLAEGAFDVVVAGIVGGFAVGVGAGGDAFVESRDAFAVIGIGVGSVLGGCDDGFVGVVVGEVYIGFVLKGWVEPAVVDTECNQVDLLAGYGAFRDGGILRLEVIGKLRAIVSTIGFCEDSKIAVLILRERRIECL